MWVLNTLTLFGRHGTHCHSFVVSLLNQQAASHASKHLTGRNSRLLGAVNCLRQRLCLLHICILSFVTTSLLRFISLQVLMLSLEIGSRGIIIQFYLCINSLCWLLPLNTVVTWLCLYVQLSVAEGFFAFISLRRSGLDVRIWCPRVPSWLRVQLETARCACVVRRRGLLVRSLLLAAALLLLSTLRAISCRSRPLNLRLQLGLLRVICLILSESNFILALCTLFGCCLTADCRLGVRKVRISCGCHSIPGRCVEDLGNVRRLGKANSSRTTCVLINPRFAKSIVGTFPNRLFVQFWWAVLLVSSLGSLISAWVYSALNMSGWSWYKTTGCLGTLFCNWIFIPLITRWLVCLLNACGVAALFRRASFVGMASFCLFPCAIFDWVPSWIYGLRWLLLLGLRRIFNVMNVFTKSIGYLVIVLSLVLSVLLISCDFWRSVFVIQGALRYVSRLLWEMRIFLSGWSISVLHSRFSSIANSCVGLGLHGVRDRTRRSSVTRTLFNLWSCKFLQISDAWFQSLYGRLLSCPRITSTILATWACWIMSSGGWTCSVIVSMSSGYSTSTNIPYACCWLRVEVGRETCCVIVLLYSYRLRCWWKIFRPLV